MSLFMFRNANSETLERGDIVVIARKQKHLPAGMTEFPVLSVDLTEKLYDTAVCGAVHDLYAEQKTAIDEAVASGEGQAAPGGASTEQRQAFTAGELERLDRTKVGSGELGHAISHGFCRCKVDADPAPIEPGDLLTTGATKGYAQKVTDPSKAVGAVLGKALGTLKKGKGTLPVLIILQ